MSQSALTDTTGLIARPKLLGALLRESRVGVMLSTRHAAGLMVRPVVIASPNEFGVLSGPVSPSFDHVS